MENDNTGVTSLPDFFSADGGLKEAEQAIWAREFKKGLWDYKDAIRRTACGPCLYLTECTHKVSRVREYDHECFNTSGQKLSEIAELYESEDWSAYGFPTNDMPLRIKPEQFIEWALSKKTITVPQEMKDWLATRQQIKCPSSQGGSNPEFDKITATNNTCERIANDIFAGDRSCFNEGEDEIGFAEFATCVQDAMIAQGIGDKFQKTAARKFFNSSPQLEHVKRGRGRKPNKNSSK